MVYYGHRFQAAQLPPPVCPKCGSHRTQVVGRSSDAKTVIVRCSSCGERSSIAMEDDSDPKAAQTSTGEIDFETVGS